MDPKYNYSNRPVRLEKVLRGASAVHDAVLPSVANTSDDLCNGDILMMILPSLIILVGGL